MKIFIIALALVAVTFAHEDISNLRGNLELHRANRAEWVEKFKAMPEEERQEKIREIREHVKNLPEETIQKMRQRFESISPERRQEMFNKIHRKFPEGAQAYGLTNPRIVPASSHTETAMKENWRNLTPDQRDEIRRQGGRNPRPAVNRN